MLRLRLLAAGLGGGEPAGGVEGGGGGEDGGVAVLDVGCHAEGGLGREGVFPEGEGGMGVDALEALGYAEGAAETCVGDC